MYDIQIDHESILPIYNNYNDNNFAELDTERNTTQYRDHVKCILMCVVQTDSQELILYVFVSLELFI